MSLWSFIFLTLFCLLLSPTTYFFFSWLVFERWSSVTISFLESWLLICLSLTIFSMMRWSFWSDLSFSFFFFNSLLFFRVLILSSLFLVSWGLYFRIIYKSNTKVFLDFYLSFIINEVLKNQFLKTYFFSEVKYT